MSVEDQEAEELAYTLAAAGEDDILIFFMKSGLSTAEAQHVIESVEDIARTVDCTVVLLPENLISDARNYTLSDLLRMRSDIESLIEAKMEGMKPIES